MSFVINEEDYLAHYGRKGMKWYQHIFGDKQLEGLEKGDRRKAERRMNKYGRKGMKVEKLYNKSEKYLARAKKHKIFFSTARENRAVNKAAKALRKMSQKGYKLTKDETGRKILDEVLKANGGYKYIDYLKNKRIYERVYRKI